MELGSLCGICRLIYPWLAHVQFFAIGLKTLLIIALAQ
jgi:hypothetical protein